MIQVIKSLVRRWRAALPKLEFRKWFRRPVRVVEAAERPKTLQPRRLYVTWHADGPAFGFMLCRCGCGETIHLRFMGNRRPRWRLESPSGRATVFPFRLAAVWAPEPFLRPSRPYRLVLGSRFASIHSREMAVPSRPRFPGSDW